MFKEWWCFSEHLYRAGIKLKRLNHSVGHVPMVRWGGGVWLVFGDIVLEVMTFNPKAIHTNDTLDSLKPFSFLVKCVLHH